MSTDAVSYTHLDVYKRQFYDGMVNSITPATCEFLNLTGSLPSFRRERLPSPLLVAKIHKSYNALSYEIKNSGYNSVLAVSYTHLT